MYIRVTIPNFRQVNSSHEEVLQSPSVSSPSSAGGSNPLWKSYFVYQIEVLVAVSASDVPVIHDASAINGNGNGLKTRYFRLEKRYSDFLSLHNELRRGYITPEFPPKKLNNTSRKLLEQRRQMLEKYIQALCRFQPIPNQLLQFFGFPESSRPASLESNNSTAAIRPTTSHGPIIGFSEAKPFLLEAQYQHRLLPDIVSQATVDFFYKD